LNARRFFLRGATSDYVASRECLFRSGIESRGRLSLTPQRHTAAASRSGSAARLTIYYSHYWFILFYI